jgi:hypothetical protein
MITYYSIGVSLLVYPIIGEYPQGFPLVKDWSCFFIDTFDEMIPLYIGNMIFYVLYWDNGIVFQFSNDYSILVG